MTSKAKALPVTCICSGQPQMAKIASTKTLSFYECEACGRLLLRSKVGSFQRWYMAEDDGTFTLTSAKEMYCPTCQSNQIHIRYVGGPWLCLKCRVQGVEKELKKEGN
jgi:ribosomal protein L37AE/L43A